MNNNSNKPLKIVGIIFAIITLLTFISSIPFPEILWAIGKNGYTTTSKIGGAKILTIVKGSPADNVGLQVRDVIIKADNQEVNTTGDLTKVIYESGGNPITLEVQRNGKLIELTITPRTKYPVNEGPTGISITDEDVKTQNVGILKRIADATIKPYLGYESIPKNTSQVTGPISIYAITTLASAKYFSYQYTGNFDYLLGLVFSIVLLFTTLGIFKRKKYAIYLVILNGLLSFITVVRIFFLLVVQIKNVDFLTISLLLWEIIFLLLSVFIFKKRYLFH